MGDVWFTGWCEQREPIQVYVNYWFIRIDSTETSSIELTGDTNRENRA